MVNNVFKLFKLVLTFELDKKINSLFLLFKSLKHC